MPSERKRYSEPGHLLLEEKIRLAFLAVKFFAPLSYKEMCEVIGKSDDGKAIRPLSGRDFLTFLRVTKALDDPDKHLWQIRALLRDMCAANLLADMGSGKDVMIGRHYYFQRELTNLEQSGWLWLAPALGPEFIYQAYSNATCQITGVANDETRAGTALVVAPNLAIDMCSCSNLHDCG